MMSANRFFVRLSTAAFLLAMMSVFGVRLRAQDVPAVHVGDTTITGIPDDWTHHHVFFSDPGTEQDAVMKGNHEQWLKTVNNPRYVIQQLKRGLPVQGPAAQDVQIRQRIAAQINGTLYQGAQSGASPERWTGPRGVEGGPRGFGPGATAQVSKTPLTRDWSMDVGGSPDTDLLTIGTLSGSSIAGTPASGFPSTLTIDGVTFEASSPTAASETGTFTGNPTTGQTVTIGGTEVLTASDSTPATGTGTFSSPPTNASTITIMDGGNTLTLATNATASSVVGTAEGGISAPGATISVATPSNALVLTDNASASSSATGTVLAAPYSNASPIITITNAVNNSTLTLTTNATGAHATGTFTAPGPTVGQNLVITEQQNANTLILTAGAAATGTIVVNGPPYAADTLTIGGQTYTFPSAGYLNNCSAVVPNCIQDSATVATMAKNIEAAITANNALCGTAIPCFTAGTTAVPNIAASLSGTTITVTNYSAAALTWTYSWSVQLNENTADLTLNPSSGPTTRPETGALPAGASGCTSSTTGTFVINPTSANGEAANVNAAINACLAAFPAVGVISANSAPSNVITVSDAVTGNYSTLTLGGTAVGADFTWSAVTAGFVGSNTCGNANQGFFATGSSAATATSDVALNISTVINACIAFGSPFTSTYPATTGNTFTVTNPNPGASLVVGATGTGVASNFTWGPPSGSNGTSGCSSSTTGNYQTSYTASGLATNIAAAITACNSSFPGVGLAAVASGVNVTVSTYLPGTAYSISSVGTTEPTNVFIWGTINPGGNGGPNACSSSTTGAYATDTSTTNLAANLAAAINACNTTYPTVGVTAAASGSVVTLTADTWGTGGNAIALGGVNDTGIFAWSGVKLTGGALGQQGHVGANYYFNVVNSPTTNAANFVSAVTSVGAGSLVTATNTAGVVTVTAVTPGTGANSTTLATNATGFAWNGATLGSGAPGVAGTNGVTSGTASTPTFAYWNGTTYGTTTALATNMAAAINANHTVGPLIIATPSAGTVLLTANVDGPTGAYAVSDFNFSALTIAHPTLQGGAAGGAKAGQSPAKYSYVTNATPSCTTDYVVYPTGAAGSATQATIVAYNNMYKSTTCTGNVPLIYWAYNTGTGSSVTLSPILTIDGKQVAYIQTTAAGVASLVLLKMPLAGTVWAGGVQTLTAVLTTAYRACTAPCFTTIPLSGAPAPNDTNSAPWWDYLHDTIYVGDNSGKLHKFTNVFISGTPIEAAAGGFPATVVSAASNAALKVLTSPVLDENTGNIYIGEGYAAGHNPLMMQVSSTGAVTPSHAGPSGSGLGTAYLDEPIIDPGSGMVYAFIGDDGAGTPSSAVYQIPEGTFGAATPVEAKLGTGTATNLEYAGSFDNNYYTTSTGHLYVCGYAGTAPALYQIPITGAVMGTAAEGAALTSGTASCSPITEVDTGTQDLIFLSVTANGSLTGCTGTDAAGACIYSFDVTSGALPSVPLAGLPASGGTGAIIIDNTTGAANVSNIYFNTLSSEVCNGNGTTGSGTGACASQASQSGLN